MFSKKKRRNFCKGKKKRVKSKKENNSLPASMKKLISDYGDVMANLCTKDVSKYDELTKYSKNAEFTQEKF